MKESATYQAILQEGLQEGLVEGAIKEARKLLLRASEASSWANPMLVRRQQWPKLPIWTVSKL